MTRFKMIGKGVRTSARVPSRHCAFPCGKQLNTTRHPPTATRHTILQHALQFDSGINYRSSKKPSLSSPPLL